MFSSIFPYSQHFIFSLLPTFSPRFLSPPYFFGPFLPTCPLYQVSCYLRAEKEYLYVHTLWQRLAAGSKSANEYPELFDKIFITGRWDANLTEKKKKKTCNCIIFFSVFSVWFYFARESSPFAFNPRTYTGGGGVGGIGRVGWHPSLFSVAVLSSLARILSRIQWWSLSMVTR